MTAIDNTWFERVPGVLDRYAAGGVVVRRAQGRTLVGLAGEDVDGHMVRVIPKGGVDPGEDVLTAARREILEETGLHELTLLGKLGVFYRLNQARSRWQNIHLFLYATEQIAGTPTDAEHHQQMFWHPLDDPPALYWPEQDRLLRDRRAEIEAALDRHASEIG